MTMLNSNINNALKINSNKAVLLSIKKQWLEKILSGEKTIEVRKPCRGKSAILL